MPTTTNNGWTIPADTDLVKDGAAAIRTLGQAIDTTLGVYTPSAGALTKISTQTVSNVSTISFNNVFTSTYKNYRIVASDLLGSGFNTLRLRVSGADNTTSNYAFRSYRGAAGGPGGDDTSQYSTSTTSFQTIYALGTPNYAAFSADIYSPQLANWTIFQAQGFDSPSNGYTVLTGGEFKATTQFDGFSILGTSMYGTVTVYGYQN
jgi:hypothetical protein